MDLRPQLAEFICEILNQIYAYTIDKQQVIDTFEKPRDEKFGDLSTSVLMRAAKSLKKNPKLISAEVLNALEPKVRASSIASRIDRLAIEGAGFLNITFSQTHVVGVVREVLARGFDYGKPQNIQAQKILLEYVSANPTGPLTVAHGRQAALGDVLANILSFYGHHVTREYYNNDEGVQINTLGKSTYHRLMGMALEEEHYQGEYLVEIAEEIKKTLVSLSIDPLEQPNKALEICRVTARDKIMETIVADMKDFGVEFDNYYSQAALGKSGKVETTLQHLRDRSHVYTSEGAAWLRTTDFGDDKDRVLIKSDGNYTYLTPDIAYHDDKFSRGYDVLINILGPDHHGYIARLKASQQALGHDPQKLHVLIAQLVTLYEGDKQVRMSTRAGEFITLRQILDEVGRDAGRFFFLMRKFDAHLDFDLQLAKSQTPDNPVFYVQYAHARIESVKQNFSSTGWVLSDLPEEADLQLLNSEPEKALLRILAAFPDEVHIAQALLEPHRLAQYARDLAANYHRFYTECRVVGPDQQLARARMHLCLATSMVLKIVLRLLGVSAPAKM